MPAILTQRDTNTLGQGGEVTSCTRCLAIFATRLWFASEQITIAGNRASPWSTRSAAYCGPLVPTDLQGQVGVDLPGGEFAAGLVDDQHVVVGLFE